MSSVYGRLPAVVRADGIGKETQDSFGGYDHRVGAGEGTIWDMENMSSGAWPALTVREPRQALYTLSAPGGLYCRGGVVYYVDGDGFFCDGVRCGTVRTGDERKRFCALGDYIIILPDMAYYNVASGEFGSLGAEWAGEVRFSDGTYAGQAAAGCAIVMADGSVTGSFPFRAGDAVEISGSANNDGVLIIREVSEDGRTLTFYENSFTVSEEEEGTAEAVELRRNVPALTFACENENRLWGCAGNVIYASALGDPFNFYVYDGVATDSYAVEVGSAGEFTACVSFLGYPCFFKEDQIYKVYGSKPSDFAVMGSASMGVAAGSGDSPAVAGEVLYYLSRVGVVAFSGGIPRSIAAPFGDVRYRSAVGGSDGERYFISMQDVEGGWHLFCYDTRVGAWHREDGSRALGFGYAGVLLMLKMNETDTGGGVVWRLGAGESTDAGGEALFRSMVEFADFDEGKPNKKGTAKIGLRGELGAGASVALELMFDSDGVWRQVAEFQTAVKRSYYLPILPRRHDHMRLRLRGQGKWTLYSITREFYVGSER